MRKCCAIVRQRPAKMFLFAATGFAAGVVGCSGPGVFTGEKEPSGIFARFHERFAKSEEATGQAFVCSAEQPVEDRRTMTRMAAAFDPFANIDQDDRSTYIVTPSEPGDIGLARVHDHRLPPAAPLGATNPFSQLRRETTPEPATTDQSTSPESKTVKSTQTPTFRFATRTRSDHRGANVPHDDMIVESAAVPRRAIWRQEVDSSPDLDDAMVAPRRPFQSVNNAPRDATPVATANLPVEITPRGEVESYVAAFTQTSRTESFSEPSESEAPAPPIEEPLVPLADPAFAVDTPIFSDEPPAVAHAEATLLVNSSERPGPTLADASTGRPTIAPPPPATSAKNMPTPLAIYSGQTSVDPVDLSDSQRDASPRKAKGSRLWWNKPIAIGLVLAFVATGAVIIRRRFL